MTKEQLKEQLKEANILLDKAEEILKHIVEGTTAWKEQIKAR